MASTKKYLDYAGLSQFWSLNKNYYSSTVSKAASALQGVQFKGSRDTEFSDLTIVDNKAQLDLSAYALKEDLVNVFVFKGTVATVADLPNTEEVKVGWIYHVTEKSAEYVCTAVKTSTTDVKWEEMGSIIDLSAYKKWSETQTYIDEHDASTLQSAKDYADTVSASALSSAKSYTDSSINSLDVTVSHVAGDDGLALEVVQEDGKLKSVNGSIAAYTYDAYGSAQAVKDYADGIVAVEAAARKDGDETVYNSIISIEDYKIKQLFIENKKSAATATDLKAAINNIGTESSVVVTLEDNVSLDERLSVAADKTVIIDLNGKTISTPDGDRAVNVASGGYCAISNGTISGNNGTYNVVVRGKNGKTGFESGSTLIFDGVTMSNSGSGNLILASNGSDEDVNIVLNNCNFDGVVYLPSRGSITINGGTFKSTDAEVLYVKNGSPIEINGASFVSKLTSASNGNWAHYNNGCVSAPAALTVEACNYGGYGNPKLSVNGGSFVVEKDGTSVEEVFPILVINYGGNTATVDCNVDYYKADGITGHVTPNGTTEPTDGWITFSVNGAAGEGKVVKG